MFSMKRWRIAKAKALLTLPELQRQVIILRDYMHLSAKHTAEALCISTGAVKAHYARGKRTMRDYTK